MSIGVALVQFELIVEATKDHHSSEQEDVLRVETSGDEEIYTIQGDTHRHRLCQRWKCGIWGEAIGAGGTSTGTDISDRVGGRQPFVLVGIYFKIAVACLYQDLQHHPVLESIDLQCSDAGHDSSRLIELDGYVIGSDKDQVFDLIGRSIVIRCVVPTDTNHRISSDQIFDSAKSGVGHHCQAVRSESLSIWNRSDIDSWWCRRDKAIATRERQQRCKNRDKGRKESHFRSCTPVVMM